MSLGYADKLKNRKNLGGQLGAKEFFESKESVEEKAKQVAEWITSKGEVFFFTGAGISTSCGIPDFRGPQGIWTLRKRRQPIPRLFTPFEFARPSLTHQLIRVLMDSEFGLFVCSQNVDNLHRRSGLDCRYATLCESVKPTNDIHGSYPNLLTLRPYRSYKVDVDAELEKCNGSYLVPFVDPDLDWPFNHVSKADPVPRAAPSRGLQEVHGDAAPPPMPFAELHGNCFRERCQSCGARYSRDWQMETVGHSPTGRRCTAPLFGSSPTRACGGILIDDVLDWDTPLPEGDLSRSQDLVTKAGVMLVLGTSLQISPANQLPSLAQQSGSKVVIVNLQRTPGDRSANLLVRTRCDHFSALLAQKLNLKIPPYIRSEQLSVSVSCLGNSNAITKTDMANYSITERQYLSTIPSVMHFAIRMHGIRSKHAPCPIIVKDAELDLEALRMESSQNDPNSPRCNGGAKQDPKIYKRGFLIQKLTDSTEDCFKKAIEIGDEKVGVLHRAEISRVKSTMGENDNNYHCQVSSKNASVVDVRRVKDKYSKNDEILTVNCNNAVGLNSFLMENGNCNKILKEDNNYLDLSNEEEDGVIFIDYDEIDLKTEKMVEGINNYIVSKNNNHTNEQRLLGSNKLLNSNQTSSSDDDDDNYELLPKQYTFLLSVDPNAFPSLKKSSLDLVLKLRLVRWADLNRRTIRLVIPPEAIAHNLSAINWDSSLQDCYCFDYQFISQIETYDLNRYAAELEKQEVTPDVKPKPKRKWSQNQARNPKTKRNGRLSSRSSARLIELANKQSKEGEGEKEERAEEYEDEEDDEL